jgi:hypothetical protein
VGKEPVDGEEPLRVRGALSIVTCRSQCIGKMGTKGRAALKADQPPCCGGALRGVAFRDQIRVAKILPETLDISEPELLEQLNAVALERLACRRTAVAAKAPPILAPRLEVPRAHQEPVGFVRSLIIGFVVARRVVRVLAGPGLFVGPTRDPEPLGHPPEIDLLAPGLSITQGIEVQ